MRKSFLVVVSMVALLAATAGPASAAGSLGSAATAANPLCESSFSSLRGLTGFAGTSSRAEDRRGAREPRLKKSGSRDQLQRGKGKGRRGFKETIPVFVHVITAGEEGNVSDAAILNQLSVLNLAYAGFYGGADTGFRFTLRKIDRTDNARWFYADPESAEEAEMKRALKRGKPDQLDLYLTNAGAEGIYLGWAYFPDIVAEAEGYLDGVIVWWGTLPGGPTGSVYSLGQTATHEIGHWLALWHTFDNTTGAFGDPEQDPNTWPPVLCSGPGDEIDDTPMQLVPTGGCPEGKDSCTQPGLDPIHNYMDYSFDSCYSEFSRGQAERMQSQYLFWREKGKYAYAQ
jgi:hypothetical protein